VGQKVQVQIAEVDDRGKLSLIPVVEESGTPAAVATGGSADGDDASE
jgi:polyribonucleotide nucleotidyltransferase